MDTLYPLPANGRHFITCAYKGATEDDAVRVVEIENSTVRLGLVMYDLPAWPGVEETHNRRDFALVCALMDQDVEWPDTHPGQTTEYYTDSNGSWCVGCGGSVWTAEEGGMVCGNPSCEKYDAERCPTWVKEIHNCA